MIKTKTTHSIFALQVFGKEIRPILKKVSRSFYLSLKILPAVLRHSISLAYLLARAADTITDTSIFTSTHRRKWLTFLKQEIENPYNQSSKLWNEFQLEQDGKGDIPEEKELLDILPHLTGVLPQYPQPDQIHIKNVVTHLIAGMEKNLDYFHHENSAELISFEKTVQLEEYCFDAAGVVGSFWSEIVFHHYQDQISISKEELIKLGIDFGNGLQMINILKDICDDLKNGRNYIPIEILNSLDIKIEDLTEANPEAGKKLLQFFIPHTLNLLQSGQKYLMNLPRLPLGLRLSVILPLWIGLETLLYLKEMNHYLNPQEIYKIPRRKVKILGLKAFFTFFSNRSLESHFLKMQRKLLCERRN